MTGQAYRTSARIAEVMGPFDGYAPNADAMLRVIRKHRAAADEIDAELVPEAHALGGEAVVGRGGLARRAARLPQRAGVGARAHRHDRPDDGLRHDRHRARARAREDQEARRRRHDAVREPDRAAGARQARLRRRSRSTTSSPTSPSTTRWSTRRTSSQEHYAVFDTADGRAADPLHGPRAHDGRGPAVHLRRHLEDREHARGGHGRRGRAALRRELEARPQGRRDLPRQLQGRPAAVGRQEEDGRRAAAGRAGAPGAQAAAACRARRAPRRSRSATPRATSRRAPTPTTASARCS